MGIHLPLLLVGAAVLVTSTGLLCAVCYLIYRLKKASAIGEQPVATVFAARAWQPRGVPVTRPWRTLEMSSVVAVEHEDKGDV